jgi:Formyl transferase
MRVRSCRADLHRLALITEGEGRLPFAIAQSAPIRSRPSKARGFAGGGFIRRQRRGPAGRGFTCSVPFGSVTNPVPEDSSLRVALLGQAAFAEKALEALVKHGDEIVHVFAPPDPPAGRPDPLKVKALELGLPLSQPESFKKDPGAFEHFKALNADLAILAFVTIIVPEPILYLPRHKSICFHPSLLQRDQLGNHQRRSRDRRHLVLARCWNRHGAYPHPEARPHN